MPDEIIRNEEELKYAATQVRRSICQWVELLAASLRAAWAERDELATQLAEEHLADAEINTTAGKYMADLDRVTAERDRLREIVERVMTMHWDMKACGCWICEAGREAGCRPTRDYLNWRGKYATVWVGEERP